MSMLQIFAIYEVVLFNSRGHGEKLSTIAVDGTLEKGVVFPASWVTNEVTGNLKIKYVSPSFINVEETWEEPTVRRYRSLSKFKG